MPCAPGASIPNTAVTQTASQNFPAQTQDTVSVQQAHQSAPQSAQQPAEQLVQQATGSFDDQILEIMEEYDEAVHGRLQKAQPEDTASTAHLGKAPTASLPADKSPCQLPRQQTAQRDAKSATQSQQHEEQRFQQIVSSAMHSKLLSKSAEPKQRSASEASAMAEQQKQSSHKQLMPQEQPQEQPPMRKQLQQQQQQACVQDDGDFECMMARFDELARQEAATSSGSADETCKTNAGDSSDYCNHSVAALFRMCRDMQVPDRSNQSKTTQSECLRLAWVSWSAV